VVPEHARQELQQILESPEYQVYLVDSPKPFWREWLSTVLENLSGFWGGVFPERSGLADGFSYFSMFVLGFLVLLFIIGLVVVFRRVSGRVLWDEKTKVARTGTPLNSGEYLMEAERWAGAQNYEQAIRALFAGLLVYLQEKGLIETKTWKTNGEYLRELQSGHKDAADVFSCLAGNYEETVYGGLPLELESYRLCRTQVEGFFGKGVAE
jgi:hypothetical protein